MIQATLDSVVCCAQFFFLQIVKNKQTKTTTTRVERYTSGDIDGFPAFLCQLSNGPFHSISVPGFLLNRSFGVTSIKLVSKHV